ncbi:MAG: SHOCT domain-containing protein [Saprospiraceae bacterium]
MHLNTASGNFVSQLAGSLSTDPIFKTMLIRRILYIQNAWELFHLEKSISKAHQMTIDEKKIKANEIIRNHVGFSMGAALVPFPAADLLAVSAVQLNMLRQLAKLYHVGFVDALGKNVISAIVGSSAARLGASLVKLIPGVGTVIGELSMPALSGASTYALGKVVAPHFASGGTLENLDLSLARKGYQNEVEEGKDVADQISKEGTKAKSSTDSTIDKIKQLAELRDAGVISEEEFTQMKSRLLAEF